MLIKQVHIDSLREQDINPRILPNTAMRQLIKNIGNRGMLESLPYCVQTDKGIEIVSGHHRVRAARAADLAEIYILLDTSGLSRDEIKAKQHDKYEQTWKRRVKSKMAIVITLKGDAEKYAALHSRNIEELEDALASVVLEKGFDDFSIESSYTDNSIRRMPEIVEASK